MLESIPTSLLPAMPAVPVAPYLGGKRNLARRIIARLADMPHKAYVEPFVGMGGVFFRRPFKAQCEVINDLSLDVANLFRILQRHYVPLMDMLRWQVTSRAEFDRLNAANPDTLTDLERAVRFLYLQRLAFGGRLRSRSFGVATTSSARFDVSKLATTLEDVHERLVGVVIERLPYAALIERYDRPSTLFYLDPPYSGCETDYGAGLFASSDFEKLSTQLSRIRGQFLLSINDTPWIRSIFAGFAMQEVQATYTIGRQVNDRIVPELLISSK